MGRLVAVAMVLLVLGGCGQILTGGAVPQRLATTKPHLNPSAAQAMINAHRARHGLRPLAIDARLTAAARAHSADLARQGRRISHRGSDGSYPKDRARRAGYNPKLASENIAAGHSRLDDVIRGWQRSRGHNANLLRANATHMGIAMVYDPKARQQTYWTLLVGASQ